MRTNPRAGKDNEVVLNNEQGLTANAKQKSDEGIEARNESVDLK